MKKDKIYIGTIGNNFDYNHISTDWNITHSCQKQETLTKNDLIDIQKIFRDNGFDAEFRLKDYSDSLTYKLTNYSLVVYVYGKGFSIDMTMKRKNKTFKIMFNHYFKIFHKNILDKIQSVIYDVEHKDFIIFTDKNIFKYQELPKI